MGRISFIHPIKNFFKVKHKAQRRIVKTSRLYHKGGIYRVIALLMHQRNLRLFPVEIYPYVPIGKNFYMPHAVGIVIGQTTQIGDDVKIFPNVVIGAKYSSGGNPAGRLHAVIGDGCFLGANSVILGGITLGKNVTVAAGAVVDIDVPDNSLVYGHNVIRPKKPKEEGPMDQGEKHDE